MKRTLATQEAAATVNSKGSPQTQAKAQTPGGQAEAPSLSRAPADVDEFDRAVALWDESRETGLLGDILSFSIDSRMHRRVVEIGTRAIRDGSPVTSAQHFLIGQLARSNGVQDFEEIAPVVRGAAEPEPFSDSIHRLRALLRTEPTNALALLDFAQLQAAIGRNDVAERALRTAFGVSPNNRLVLRTLARFYVHTRDYDRALHEIRRHQRTSQDPWLIASEIALADLAEKPSSFLAKGRRMLLEAGKAPPASFTELAASLAMAELSAGNAKKARELQRLALLEPTDNVAAQAVDRQRQFGIALSAPNVTRAIASSAEAQLLQSWSKLIPDAVEEHALVWHSEEPFSSRPIQILTSVYAYKGEHVRALNWLLAGLRSDPEDRGLLTNLAYVQARLGQVSESRLTMLKARRLHGAEAEPYLRATEGLLAYQQGRFEDGDSLYSEAVLLLDGPQTRGQNISTFCLLNQAIVALEYQHPNAASIVARTNEALEKRPNPDASMLLRMGIAEEIERSAAVPTSAGERLTTQWVFDRKRNTLTARNGLTARGASPIVVVDGPQKKG